MIRLGICAFGAFVITNTAVCAQDAQSAPDASAPTIDILAAVKATGDIGLYDSDGRVLLGRDKTAPLCPPFCAPRRVTSPEAATVGEREVMTITMAAAATDSKLRVDSRRTTWARMEKQPAAMTATDTPTAVTRNAFRPALDPVLAEPKTEPTE